ncbi:MAG TPA: demethoxyubiquinone hydroxylase family protein [Thermoanaerobaculaceae bacterium]|nr:demethoxyubiquinone hydroxylase family protein [Thermoanaerobaculaceae bacterium]
MAIDMDFSKIQPHDVLDLAIFAEEEAHEQYEHFAAIMESHGNRDVARFFEKMAYREKLHREQLAERRKALYADAVANLANRAVWGIEAPYEEKATAAMTPAAAFTLALAAEKKAERYYAAALQHLTHPEVTSLFETLRQSEIEHQRMLQLEMAKQA